MVKYVYDFSRGDKDQKDLLGGKGANLAEMTRLGLPVPPDSLSLPKLAAFTLNRVTFRKSSQPRSQRNCARLKRQWVANLVTPPIHYLFRFVPAPSSPCPA